MLTGYNTDVSFGGEIFHVQTEDKGIHSPIILSLVYRGGTILAAKRTSYSNLIENGVVDETAVSQMLVRQHQVLVAAIQAGKSEKLVELSRVHQGPKGGKQEAVLTPLAAAPDPANASTPSRSAPVAEAVSVRGKGVLDKTGRVEIAPAPAPVGEVKSYDTVSFDQIIAGYLKHNNVPEQLRIELLYPSKFRAGDEVSMRAAVLIGGHSPANGTLVKLQILGTKIEAQTLTSRTDFQGLVNFNFKIPTFTSGAAALILKASDQAGQEAEVKFMIRRK